MDFDSWTGFYKRLTSTFAKPISGEQSASYFEVLQAYPTTCVQQAVQSAIRTSKHWPSAADLVELASQERAKLHGELPDARNSCPECHGDLWVPGPSIHQLGNVYESVQRCQRCRPSARQGAA